MPMRRASASGARREIRSVSNPAAGPPAEIALVTVAMHEAVIRLDEQRVAGRRRTSPSLPSQAPIARDRNDRPRGKAAEMRLATVCRSSEPARIARLDEPALRMLEVELERLVLGHRNTRYTAQLVRRHRRRPRT